MTATKKTITIFCNGVWAGTGTVDADGYIRDCSAVLGNDQDASDATYELIEEAIEAGDDRASRADGEYTWNLDVLDC